VLVHGGSGAEARFVVENGIFVDRLTDRALPPLTLAAPAAVDEWIRVLRAESCEPVLSAESAPGRILPEAGVVRP
jgi:hypothetical protein